MQKYLINLTSVALELIPLPPGNASNPEKDRFQETIYQKSVQIEPRTALDKADLPAAERQFSDLRTAKARRDCLLAFSKSVRSRTTSRTPSTSGPRHTSLSTLTTQLSSPPFVTPPSGQLPLTRPKRRYVSLCLHRQFVVLFYRRRKKKI